MCERALAGQDSGIAWVFAREGNRETPKHLMTTAGLALSGLTALQIAVGNKRDKIVELPLKAGAKK